MMTEATPLVCPTFFYVVLDRPIKKHLSLRQAVVRQAVERGIMNVVAVLSKEQLADLMCKQADKASVEAMRDAVLGMSTSDVDDSLRVGEASGASCTKRLGYRAQAR